MIYSTYHYTSVFCLSMTFLFFVCVCVCVFFFVFFFLFFFYGPVTILLGKSFLLVPFYGLVAWKSSTKPPQPGR